MQILALSSSRVGKSGYLEEAAPLINHFLKDGNFRIAFVPFADADNDYNAYVNNVKNALPALADNISVVLPENAHEVITNSDAIMVGGGNTFKLLHDLYQLDVLDLICSKVSSGAPYIGWSAGSNITSPTICTTNDMPVIEPKSFRALGFFPFQVNPHYFNKKIDGFNGETRDQRLEEFMKLNPGISVVGLPEGCALLMKNNRVTFSGNVEGVLFQHSADGNTFARSEIGPGLDLSFLI